jgi:hypothetical protein
MHNRNLSHSQSDIERVVMRRVLVIRILRPLLSVGTLAVLIFALALWGIGREVWVAHVFENAPTTLSAASRFWLYAFEHTRLVVQALTLLTLGSLIYVARATTRPLASLFAAPLRA